MPPRNCSGCKGEVDLGSVAGLMYQILQQAASTDCRRSLETQTAHCSLPAATYPRWWSVVLIPHPGVVLACHWSPSYWLMSLQRKIDPAKIRNAARLCSSRETWRAGKSSLVYAAVQLTGPQLPVKHNHVYGEAGSVMLPRLTKRSALREIFTVALRVAPKASGTSTVPQSFADDSRAQLLQDTR